MDQMTFNSQISPQYADHPLVIAQPHRILWIWPGLLLVCLGVICQVSADFISPENWTVTGSTIIASGVLLLPSIWSGLRRPVEELIADHLLLLSVVFVVYFVMGGLLLSLGPKEEVEYALSYHPINASMGLRVTAVNCIGMGLALITGTFLNPKAIQKKFLNITCIGSSLSHNFVVTIFLVIGGISSFVVFRFDLGMTSETVIPGFFRMTSQFLNIVIVIAASYRGRQYFLWIGLATLLVLVQSFMGTILLNKSVVLVSICAMLVGLTIKYGVRKIALPGLLGLLVLFRLIGGPFNSARNNFGLGGRIQNWDERIEFLKTTATETESTQGDRYRIWSRFCYLPAQGAAMDFYDNGQGGDDFFRAGWLFLPRFLFVDKPIISSGHEFNLKAVGQDSSASAPGIFADGYFNLGWWGVVLVGVSIGSMLAVTSALANAVFRSRVLIWLPLALMGNFMAYRIDGHFINDFLGPFVMFCYCLLFVSFFSINKYKPWKRK